MYPTFAQIKALHSRVATDEKVFELVFTHCQIVRDISLQVIKQKKLTVDTELVIAGSLLHDIGAYQLIDRNGVFDSGNYIQHGVKGYKILTDEGYPERLCRIAERHTGVGVTVADIRTSHLPLPEKDYLAETLEEQIVMYADKFHSKNPCFNSFESYCIYVRRFGEEKVEAFKHMVDKFGLPDLESLAKKYHHQIV